MFGTRAKFSVYTKNFRVCHFFSQLFPAAKSASIKLVLNHTKIKIIYYI